MPSIDSLESSVLSVVKMVSFIERFERNPSLNVADSLAQALGLKLSDMIAEAEAERKKQVKKR